MLKIWITGSNGQVGTALNELIEPLDIEVLNTDKDEIDITNTNEVIRFGEINRPDVIINCAAITDIKECANDKDQAFRVNALGPRNLCIVARKIGAKVVQISTDDVFDGTNDQPYNEFDLTNPKTVYGCSKKAGEDYVKEFTHKHFIIRSNWVYGKNGNNFVNEFLNCKEKVFDVSSNQLGSPTSAKDLARAILYLIQTSEYGTYHITCKGVCSRYEFAQTIKEKTNSIIELNDINSNGDETIRPAYAVLDNFILRLVNEYEMPNWKESLNEYLKEIKEG
ncbi:dTDP-4-dehydrorhamnose reductase [Thomasclavelia sp.]